MPSSKNHQMKITWTYPAFDGSKGERYFWTAEESKNLPTEKEDVKIEKQLNAPKGSIGVLRSAFQKNLNRFLVWDLSQVARQKDKFLWAAKVYKRGVATSSHTGEKSKSGSYNLTFCADENYAFNKFKKGNFVVADGNFLRCWPFLEEDVHLRINEISETNKKLSLVAEIIEKWAELGKPQNWVVAGGGILNDVGAFAASLVDANVILMPTTLLSMADASVGGKTGVNFEEWGKNQLGTFYFPKEVVIWRGWLQTLKREEIRSGGSECLKHTILIGNRELSLKVTSCIKSNDMSELDQYLPKLIDLKRRVVCEDATEKGKRVILNFGHTLAHALESRSQRNESKLLNIITHGEAVAVGMCFAAYVSHKLYDLPEIDLVKIWKLLIDSQCLPTKETLETYLVTDCLPENSLWRELLGYMEFDKKHASDSATTIPFVLLKKFGVVMRNKNGGFTIDVPKGKLGALWKTFIQDVYKK